MVLVTHQNPHTESDIAQMFNKIAPRYDFLNALLSVKQDQRWRKKLVSHVPYQPDGFYLDVATGTGDVLSKVCQTRDEYKQFCGIDISVGMIELAKMKCQNLKNCSAIEFRNMSAETLIFEKQTFDCITIAFGLRNIINRNKAILEFNRVLKPGGTLLILDFFTPHATIRYQFFKLYFKHILPVIGGIFSDKAAYRYLPQSVGSFYTVSELYDILKVCGFYTKYQESFLFGGCHLVKAIKFN